ncbi:MAG: response regulator, partial [Proteobacteria bacterium]|nr:response regulator [Pseudomonadota bacterium]
QSLKNKPAPALIKQGTIALDGRYLNFAPQCTGWQNLTQNGGSGSLVIFWSGLWKLSTAAAIPYHTGIYGNHPRGFGFVTIGANVHEFHRAATETAEKIDAMVAGYETELATQAKETKQNLTTTLAATARNLALSTIVMAFVVILIAIWMASTLTKKITSMIAGVRRFQQGEMNARLEVGSTDEMGQLSQAFNDMSNSVQTAFHDLTQAESKFRNIVEHATVGIFQSTMEGRLISVNPAMARMLGYDSPDQMTSEIKDLATQFYAEQDHRAHFLEQLHVEDSLNEEEFLAYRRDGTIGSFTSNSRLVRDQAGKALYIEGMLLDITDRKEKERAQRERNMAESANLAKSEFLARMSHEIRTPMNAVIGVADLLEEYELDREQKILVNLLKTSGDNLLALIDDILDLSKIEAGKTILEDTPFDLREEVASLCSLLAHRAFEKNLEFDYDIGPHVPSLVLGDHLRLRQVLTNLIGNAIKFTFEGEILLSVYTLEATPKRVQLVFKVTDTGIGIPKDKLAHVFESFGQADSSTTRSSSGTGLGLTISQKLVNLMGGDIQVQSRLGEGSVFSFSLPMLVIPDSLRPAKLPPAPLNGLTILVADGFTAGRERVARILTRSGAKVTEAASRREALAAVQAMSTAGLTFDVALIGARLGDLSGFEMARTLISQAGMAGRIFMLLTTTNLLRNADILRELGQPRYLTKPINEHDLLTNLTGLAQKSTPSDHPQFGSDLKTKQMDKRLLVVDDAEDNRVILNQYLKTSGYKYTMAENGNTALQHFRDTPYDLVILDMQMPTMDGYTTATKMREMEREEKRSPVPIIALTAHAMADDRQKCLDAGCSDYLTKPIRKAALLEALVKHLEEQTNS